MKNGLKILGFSWFIIEAIVATIYGLSYVPWTRFGALFTEKVILTIFVIIWNIAGAIFLWLGYSKDRN